MQSQSQQQQLLRFMTGAARGSSSIAPATLETADGQTVVVEPTTADDEVPFSSAAGGDASGNRSSGAINVLLKLLFYLCVILQTVLWPSVVTITFTSLLALESLFHLFILCIDTPSSSRPSPSLMSAITDYSVLFLHNRKVSTAKYIAVCLVTAYMLVFFSLFVAHETRIQPVQTMWIDRSLYGKYLPFLPTSSDDASQGHIFSTRDGAPDVTGEVSKKARDPGFEWPRTLQRPAIIVNGTIPTTPALDCPAVVGANTAYQCFSSKLAVYTSPKGDSVYVPFPSSFYSADVILTPAAGTACEAIEAYRVLLDDDLNIAVPLDYPASVHVAADASANTKCGVFGVSGWCLPFKHSFTTADYAARVAEKCTQGGGQLTIRLPSRAPDYYPQSGRTGQDILVVTAGTHVQVRFLWHDLSAPSPLLDAWEETPHAYDDNAQSWRDSHDSTSVFFKFAIAAVPLLICWYYLAVSFHEVVADYQILLLCLFVLLPSALVFLLVGAFLPMAGLIVCVLAINSAPYEA